MKFDSDRSLVEFLNLGPQPISNSFPIEPWSSPNYRLAAGVDTNTGLVQLIEQPPAESMFHAEYAFETRTSRTMSEHFDDCAAALLDRFSVEGRAAKIVEIGSNDGVFLESCQSRGAQVLGVDPSSGVNEIARSHGIEVWEDFFSVDCAREIVESKGRFDVAFSANALCHIPNFDMNLVAFKEILADKGILVFEDPYLGSVLRRSTYDQFYDEHNYMFCATSVSRVARRHELFLFDVEELSSHGGSMRYFLSKEPLVISDRLSRVLEWEALVGVDQLETLFAFAARVQASRDFLATQLGEIKKVGLPVVGLGAASKTVTVLNYCGLSSSEIELFSDSTPAKSGRYMAGTDIPVVRQSELKPQFEYVGFLGAHNHEREIVEALQRNHAAPAWLLSSVPFSVLRPVAAI